MSKYIKKFAEDRSEELIAESAKFLTRKPKRQGSNQTKQTSGDGESNSSVAITPKKDKDNKPQWPRW